AGAAVVMQLTETLTFSPQPVARRRTASGAYLIIPSGADPLAASKRAGQLIGVAVSVNRPSPTISSTRNRGGTAAIARRSLAAAVQLLVRSRATVDRMSL